ncbi:MAG: hypothetical protein WC780_00380 [Lentimicrobiaceae bacterium]|jgi:hypothetical protein
MKRKKKRIQPKLRKKRTKKYQGAAAQSARDKENRPNNYEKAANYLSSYNSNINSLANQLRFVEVPNYQNKILSAFSGIQSQLSTFSSFNNLLPNLDHLKYSSHALDISRDAILAYSKLSTLDTISNLTSVVSKRLPDWYNQTFLKSPFLNEFDSQSGKYLSSSQAITEMLGAKNLSAFSVQSALAKATEYSLYTEKSLSSFPWQNLGLKIGLTATSKAILGNSFLGFSDDYDKLLKSFSSDPKSFAELSPSITRIAPIEYFTGANLLESISVEEESQTTENLLKNELQYENEYTLNKYLPLVNSGLLNMWKGAIETFNSRNSDKVRQFTVSLRELFGHLMHILAPDEDIKKWTTDSTYFDKGKPTRRARLHYIYRNISNQPFNKFAEQNIKATLEFIAIFQDGTHSIDSGFSQQQLIALKSKAETTLKFLIEIEFSVNRQ